jgi:Iron-containing redox enzyme
MTPFEDLSAAWATVERRFMGSTPIKRLLAGDLAPVHYAAYLRETYFYTRENPQIQALATAWFRGADRQMVKPFLRHALSEVGHDALALADLKTLGWKIDSVPEERPLPSTTPLISFPFYAIQYRSPLSYLGYLFFLEFLPTAQGADIAAALTRVGVPTSAMTFLAEHRAIDVHHNRLMKEYAATMLRSASDIDEVVYCMEVTCELYAIMVDGAFESADRTETIRLRSLAAA